MARDLKAETASFADTYGLSPMQEGMLTLSGLAPGLDVTQVVCSLPEAIDANAMKVAWQQLADRHAVLRTSFHADDHGRASQRVHPNAVLPLKAAKRIYRPGWMPCWLKSEPRRSIWRSRH